MHKAVTVLMPTRNSALFIGESLQSIESESAVAEILVLDSASSDGTLEIAKKYSKVKVVQCGEMGISEALNSSKSHIGTKYAARMDADDISRNNRFSLQLNFLIAGDYDLVGSDIVYHGRNSWYLNYIKNRHFTVENLNAMFIYKSPIVHPTWLMKSELLFTIHYRNQLAEDYDFLVRAKMAGAKLGILNEELLLYRLNPNQVSKSKRAILLSSSNDVSNSYISWYTSALDASFDQRLKNSFFRTSYSSVNQLISDFEQIRTHCGNLFSNKHLKEIFFRLLFRLTRREVNSEIFSFMKKEFGLAFSLDMLPLLIRVRT
jgi:glycosyltransferase involved in cell wall biosynthesis